MLITIECSLLPFQYECVGKLDPTNPKSMKIELDQQVVRKILKQHPKKLKIYYEKISDVN